MEAEEASKIDGFDGLEHQAKQAAQELAKASSHNAILDRATKSLKQGLANLDKARADATAAAEQAEKLSASLADSFNNDKARRILALQHQVDEQIDSHRQAISNAEKALKEAQGAAAAASEACKASSGHLDEAQQKLLSLTRAIQDGQKQIAGLQAEIKDAQAKQQWVDAVVKLEDLGQATTGLQRITAAEYEANLWKELSAAVNDLIVKTDAVAKTEADVSTNQAGLDSARKRLADAEKGRLDAIRKLLANEPKGGAAP